MAVIPWELPEIMKQGHSDTCTSDLSCAAMAYVNGGCPSAVLKEFHFPLEREIMLGYYTKCMQELLMSFISVLKSSPGLRGLLVRASVRTNMA